MEFEHKINNQKYKVVVEKKNNKNTYIRVKNDLSIQVTTNYFVTKWQIKALLNDNKDYIAQMLSKRVKQQERESNFYYLGKKYDIIIVPFEDIEIDDNKIYIPSEEKLNKWLKKQTKELFKTRIDYNYSLFEENIPYPIIKIRKMKTRWGVNNKRDNSITLNSKLIEYKIECLDYVIIHELSHFVHFDHSRNFWNIVSKYCPDYKKIRNYLKKEEE